MSRDIQIEESYSLNRNVSYSFKRNKMVRTVLFFFIGTGFLGSDAEDPGEKVLVAVVGEDHQTREGDAGMRGEGKIPAVCGENLRVRLPLGLNPS